MKKSELLNWLHDEYRQWQAFLDEIDPQRMEEPGACGRWSMKDIVAHLAGWQIRQTADMQAAGRGEPQPPPPWPAHLEDEDDINAWIYEANRERPLDEILAESDQVFQRHVAMIEALPDDVRIERDWRLVWLGDQRFPAGEFFDHFHDDHEPEIRAWLAKTEKQ